MISRARAPAAPVRRAKPAQWRRCLIVNAIPGAPSSSVQCSVLAALPLCICYRTRQERCPTLYFSRDQRRDRQPLNENGRALFEPCSVFGLGVPKGCVRSASAWDRRCSGPGMHCRPSVICGIVFDPSLPHHRDSTEHPRSCASHTSTDNDHLWDLIQKILSPTWSLALDAFWAHTVQHETKRCRHVGRERN